MVGTDCCLDKDDNSICDKDDVEQSVKKDVNEESKTTSAPKCGDGICQETESCNSCFKDCGECYTISDLQADIGNIYWDVPDEFLVLRKDKKIDNTQFYVFQIPKSVRLGQLDNYNRINKVIPKTFVIVSVFESEKDFIEEGSEFFEFIKKHDEYLTHSLILNKKTLIEEFKEGDFFKMLKKKQNLIEYVDHSFKENVIVDNLELLETVSNKIVTRDFVALDDYEVTYDYETEGGRTKHKTINMKGLGYLQIASIFCTPRITITVYNKELPEVVKLEEGYLNDHYKNKKRGFISDAQALINMCEDRYEFDYWRWR